MFSCFFLHQNGAGWVLFPPFASPVTSKDGLRTHPFFGGDWRKNPRGAEGKLGKLKGFFGFSLGNRLEKT